MHLYDAPRCPYCARVRIVLAEKGLAFEPVRVDLEARPAWLVELNPPHGRVPVLEDDGLVLPESAVIMAYLDERYPDPPLLPLDPAERALARLTIERFQTLGRPYYDLHFGRPDGSSERLAAALEWLDRLLEGRPYLGGRAYGLADIAYVPWVLRAEARLAVSLAPYEHLGGWLERLLERPAVAEERTVVASL